MKALIISAGVCGPVSAMALKRAGIDAMVYEAHGAPAANVGSYLTVATNGLDALRAIDAHRLLESFGEHTRMRIGFIGLGVMGQPMACNLARAGQDLLVWNRTADKGEPLRALGAVVVSQPAEVFERAAIVFLMLFDEAATDAVLQRGSPAFAAMVGGRTIVNMSSVSPEYSQALARDVEGADGRFVEAPVSGSRVPAESGQLVAMLGGDRATCEEIRRLLAPMCHEAVYCGAIGSALLMKFAVNIFMLSTAVGLAEAVHFADRHGLDRRHLQAVLNAGPMASQLSRIKMAKLIAGDFSTQGTVRDGKNNTALITAAAKEAHVAAGLISVCRDLYKEAVDLGYGAADMIAVIRAMEARSDALQRAD